jgi:hypothetical protein
VGMRHIAPSSNLSQTEPRRKRVMMVAVVKREKAGN